jgi:hypothetical protein
VDTREQIRELIRQTPGYLQHVTVGVWLLENLLKELEELERKIKQLENERGKF